MSLHGKVVLVTGASRGIGREIALACAHAGADVACAATTEANAMHTVDPIVRLGRRAVAIGARVEQAQAVDAMLERVTRSLGPVDVLVNNAGIPQVKPVVEMEEADWDAVMDINAKGAFLCARAVARQLRARKAPGVILNIGSISAINAFPSRLAYCASKAALHQMTKVMAIEWAKDDIRVNCIAPGYIQSDLTESLSQRGLLDVAKLRGRIPQGKLGSGQDVAHAAVYLASDEARYVTGAVLAVDGGWLAYGFV
jgi:NAD(P)-dependent dehydrogenase (short-subunit alcohol dehydrogenase family)